MASNYANIIAGLPREVTDTRTTEDIQNIYGVDPSTASVISSILGGGLTTLSKAKDALEGWTSVKGIFNDIFG
jgi:hypothetical protein